MNHQKLLQGLISGGLILPLALACNALTAAPVLPTTLPTPIPPTPVPTSVPTLLPVTTEPTCGTVVTLIEADLPSKFGETQIEIEFLNYAYDGIIAGGGFVEPRNGNIAEVHIGGKTVMLTRNDFGEGYIYTQEFGPIKVLFASNVLQDCALLVATPEQVTEILNWIR